MHFKFAVSRRSNGGNWSGGRLAQVDSIHYEQDTPILNIKFLWSGTVRVLDLAIGDAIWLTECIGHYQSLVTFNMQIIPTADGAHYYQIIDSLYSNSYVNVTCNQILMSTA